MRCAVTELYVQSVKPQTAPVLSLISHCMDPIRPGGEFRLALHDAPFDQAERAVPYAACDELFVVG